jgi:hypothetical protein
MFVLTTLTMLAMAGAAQSAKPDSEAGVHIQARQTGQGVLRGRGPEWFVVTPYHVVEGSSDAVRVVGGRSSQAKGEVVRQLPGDLAILRVDAAGTLPCGDWTPPDDLQALLRGQSAGTLSMREADGSQTLMPVTFRGIDDEMIFVRPTRSDDQISKSMSGGSLLVNGVVVGMLLSVDGGVGNVYQVDDIMRVSAGFFSPAATRSGDALYVGEYNLGGAMVKIQSSPAGLQYIQAGNPVHTLVSSGGRRYTSPTIPGSTLEFRLDDGGEVDSLYLLLPQAVVHGARVDGPAPDAATLALLAGTYDLTPTVAAAVSLRDGRLIYRVTGDPKDYVLAPARGLHFAFEGTALFSIRFYRSANKQVSHFVLYAADSSVVGTRRK